MSVADRYALSELRDLRKELAPETIALQSDLANLIRLSEFSLTARPFGARQRVAVVPFHVTIETSTASTVGRTIRDIDLELRRCSALQLRDTTSPSRDFHLVVLVSIQSNDVLEMSLAVSGELHHALTSRPIDLLLTLDWIWDSRYARSRVRSPLITHDPKERWADILSSALTCKDLGRSVITTMAVEEDGSTAFSFRSAETLS